MTKTPCKTTKKKRKAYDRESNLRTRKINRERLAAGLPKLKKKYYKRKTNNPYNYTAEHVHVDPSRRRKFKGKLGENMKRWSKR